MVLEIMRPLTFFVPAFIFGLLVARAVEPAYSSVLVLLLISLALLTSATIKGGKVRLILACPAFFALGLLYLLPTLNLYAPLDNIRNISVRDEGVRLEGVVSGTLKVRGEGVRFYLDTTGVNTGGEWRKATGRVQITTKERGTLLERVHRGDTVRLLARLKVPKNFGNPGGFDYEWWLRTRGVAMTAYLKPGLIIKTSEGEVSLLRSIDTFRTGLGVFIDNAGLKHAGILKALTIGEKGEIPDDVKEDFRSSGTAHLLAISGLHVGFVAFISFVAILWLLKRSSRLMLAIDVRRTAIMVSFVPVFFYGVLSGFSLSTQRAVIMIGAYVVTVAICRVRDLYSILALAALVVLLVSPASLWDVGFQLSFTAVLAIVYVMTKAGDVGSFNLTKNWVKLFWWRVVLRLRDFTLITIAASLATAPLIVFYFHRVFAVGFIANLIIVPIATFLVVPLALLAVVVYPVSHALSRWLMLATDFVLGIVVGFAGFFGGLDWAFSWVATPGIFEVAAFYFAFTALPLFILRRDRGRGFVLLAVGIAFLIGALGYEKYTSPGTAEMEVTFISVGQGDAALVEFPAGQGGRRVRMLIDGGGFSSTTFDSGKDIIAPFLWKKKITHLDYLVLSHPQRDHMRGLRFIAENFSPGEFWWSGRGRISDELARVLNENKVKVVELGAGSSPIVIGGVNLEPLAPPFQSAPLDVNDSSLVLRLVYGKRRILFTGDIAEAGEESLTRYYTGEELRADILKAPHHGSRFSSSDELLRLVSPKVVVISAGHQNSFGFPHGETLDRYRSHQAIVYRTDLAGAVTVASDGQSLDVRSHLTGK